MLKFPVVCRFKPDSLGYEGGINQLHSLPVSLAQHKTAHPGHGIGSKSSTSPASDQGQTIYIGRVFWLTGKVARKEHYLFWYYVILFFVVVLGFAVRNLLRSKHGRCLVAVRDNDRAADAMGMHPGFTKVYAFALSGFFAGIAGALHAYLWRGVGFESFTLHHSISYLAMAIVGGLGTQVGSFVGPAAILMLELQVENFAEFVGHYFSAIGDVATAFR